jgi:hypothetical protein
VKDIDSWSKEQNYLNWQRSVEMANQWRRMLDVPEVDYPYPGDPRSGLSLNA